MGRDCLPSGDNDKLQGQAPRWAGPPLPQYRRSPLSFTATRRCCGLHFEVASVLHLTTIFQQRWGRHSSHQNMQSNVPYAGFWNLYHTYLWNWSSRSTVRANILKLNMVFQFRARCAEARAVRGTSSAHLPREGRWVRYVAPSLSIHRISSDSVARYTLYA